MTEKTKMTVLLLSGDLFIRVVGAREDILQRITLARKGTQDPWVAFETASGIKGVSLSPIHIRPDAIVAVAEEKEVEIEQEHAIDPMRGGGPPIVIISGDAAPSKDGVEL